MSPGAQSRSEPRHGFDREPDSARKPEVTVCECGPGRSVFIESDNTDGWIAMDDPVDIRR
ncbi:hypothetical protein [Halorubrum cibi]|uniref:Uncharacterized protein n=1 Tax=Halorubrum cibi TaxID=413815 RepID=A0A521D639_9EURY|nr:hypothetical protein [Halorubrum cibi]SMO67173.1 hypothetical protein SAMN06264867_10640 [Halorubrum cibi]